MVKNIFIWRPIRDKVYRVLEKFSGKYDLDITNYSGLDKEYFINCVHLIDERNKRLTEIILRTIDKNFGRRENAENIAN